MAIILTSLLLDEFRLLIQECVSSALEKSKSQETKPIENNELITESDLSNRLHRSKVTLGDWRKRGLLPFYRISRKIYYNWTEVLAALKKIERKEN